MNEHRTCVFF